MTTYLKDMRAPPPAYAVLYPVLVAIAKEYGYALAIHGSMTRDFDLIAVPWDPLAGNPLSMAERMRDAVQGVFVNHEVEHLLADGKMTTKPHGRMCWAIHLTNLGAAGPYIDLSVMPRSP